MGYDYTALRADLGEDLRPLSALLASRGLPHRIFEEAGYQILKVTRTEHVQRVQDLYRAWRDGGIVIEPRPGPPRTPGRRRAIAGAHPVTLLLLGLSIVGFLLVYLGAPVQLLAKLTFNPVVIREGQLVFGPMGTEYWRLVTPAFLHFGWLHITFNSLWMWDLGGRIERVLGSLHLAGLFLVTAIVANISQAFWGGPSLFGGMSGVVYGLLGFSWTAAKLQPRWAFSPPQPVMLLMLGWLVICILGFTESVGFGSVANAAHLGGLLSGVALGAGFGLLSRYNALSDRGE